MKCQRMMIPNRSSVIQNIMNESAPNDLLDEVFRLCNTSEWGSLTAEGTACILNKLGHVFKYEEAEMIIRQCLEKDTKDPRVSAIDMQTFLTIISSAADENQYQETATEDMSVIYRSFDLNGDGYITDQDLKQIFISLGENVDEQEIQGMIAEADRDGDGKVTYDDFLRLFTNYAPIEIIDEIDCQAPHSSEELNSVSSTEICHEIESDERLTRATSNQISRRKKKEFNLIERTLKAGSCLKRRFKKLFHR